jgi:hypothetical protein
MRGLQWPGAGPWRKIFVHPRTQATDQQENVGALSRFHYYRRILSAYSGSGASQLTFWHDSPEPNLNFAPGSLGEYYMPFLAKADYSAHLDGRGIPQLDYRGSIGLQYNPIAIAQYGLGNYNQWIRTREPERRLTFLRVAQWLLDHLEPNPAGLRVWMHHFDWEYRDRLRAPWYSGLAQGQGISVLVRAHLETGDARFLTAAREAFEPLMHDVASGGVCVTDQKGRRWIEEYIVHPPTHILNGFLWALWGVYDFVLATSDQRAAALFAACNHTLEATLESYDTGYWSLYEHSGTRLPMVASRFYHRLHIAQLRVQQRLTGIAHFGTVADRWEAYAASSWSRRKATAYKVAFKLWHY